MISRMTLDKIAEDILKSLKYNSDLPDELKLVAIQTRLENLVNDVKKSCEDEGKISKANAVVVDNRPYDIPVLAEAMLKKQQERGSLN